ncbi:MAG: carboxypeptidase regulatory-like domain-containing protein [Gammaproteobacteria bacterium]|nr:MAG: carboxypeptidase regulatory-like domain-containing protein [Gammaproteobacteria bacterium]
MSNIISLNARGIAASNRLVHQETSGLDPIFTGTLQLSTHYSRMSLRGTLNYELDPDSEIDSVALTADPGQFGKYRLSLGLTHAVEPDLTEVSISANKASGRYNLSLGTRYNSDDEITLNVGLSFGLGHEPRRRQWYTDARALAANGSVSARAFLDGNQDGIYNDGDEPIADVGFRLNGGYSALRTDEDGIGFLTGLPAHQPLNLSVAPETVADPLWTIALDGVRVVPRPGHAMQLDFPVFLSGEIDGTVYVARDGKEYGAGRVIVELLDTEGSVIKTVSTAYDGFYVMSKIPLGQYRLRVSTQQQAELGLVADRIETFTISADELFVNGLDFVLRERKP